MAINKEDVAQLLNFEEEHLREWGRMRENLIYMIQANVPNPERSKEIQLMIGEYGVICRERTRISAAIWLLLRESS